MIKSLIVLNSLLLLVIGCSKKEPVPFATVPTPKPPVPALNITNYDVFSITNCPVISLGEKMVLRVNDKEWRILTNTLPVHFLPLHFLSLKQAGKTNFLDPQPVAEVTSLEVESLNAIIEDVTNRPARLQFQSPKAKNR